jgi:hypothetical protein
MIATIKQIKKDYYFIIISFICIDMYSMKALCSEMKVCVASIKFELESFLLFFLPLGQTPPWRYMQYFPLGQCGEIPFTIVFFFVQNVYLVEVRFIITSALNLEL